MRFTFVALLCLPVAAFASGSSSITPPKPTETTQTCKGVQVWDTSKNKCVNPKQSALDADTLYAAVRELAYAGRYHDAQEVLRTMPDQTDDRVLTYWGFTYRKLGDMSKGMAFYQQALEKNPANILTRSYMGQALVEQGKITQARAQLSAIRKYQGAGTWPEKSLAKAINTGETYEY